MIKESLQQSIKLIEDIENVDPAAYEDEKRELEDLIQHMRIVIARLNTKAH